MAGNSCVSQADDGQWENLLITHTVRSYSALLPTFLQIGFAGPAFAQAPEEKANDLSAGVLQGCGNDPNCLCATEVDRELVYGRHCNISIGHLLLFIHGHQTIHHPSIPPKLPPHH
jgi:hypothetical protein